MVESTDFWAYRARTDGHPSDAVVDGDTLDLIVDLGFNCRHAVRVRLKGLDTAEIYGVRHDSDTYQDGMDQRGFVVAWLQAAQDGPDAWPLVVRTKDTGKYGRWVATITDPLRDRSLNDAIRATYPETDET